MPEHSPEPQAAPAISVPPRFAGRVRIITGAARAMGRGACGGTGAGGL